MATIIDGKKVAAEVRAELKEKIEKMVAETKRRPALAVILVGEDPASQVYVRNKQRACEEIGVASEVVTLAADITQEMLEYIINSYAARVDIDGILVQMPLPKGLDGERALACIPAEKDVDAFHPENVGHIMRGDYRFLPCTPAGVMELLHRYGISPAGKKCVVIGRSDIVGKPMAMMLLHENGTVEICHSKTPNLAEETKTADILVAAVGRPKFVTADMVKEGAVVIDVVPHHLYLWEKQETVRRATGRPRRDCFRYTRCRCPFLYLYQHDALRDGSLRRKQQRVYRVGPPEPE